VSEDFVKVYLQPHEGILVKICRAYAYSQEEFEDLYQEVCLQLWRSRDKFEGRSKWSTFVYRVALNVCLSLTRSRKPRTELEEAPLPTAENEAFANEDLRLLYGAIRRLAEADRALILLYLEEKSYKEMAEILGTNTSHIGVKINRIKKRLKKLLDGTLN
jgi:RNA polymerase sigma-70 factor (ECF subfamily)